MDDIFLRNRMLLGDASVEALLGKSVAVFGLGGVGGYAAEAVARAGVGNITLVDFDTVGFTNINRQIAALHSTLGVPKAEVMKSRLLDINPEARVAAIVKRYEAQDREAFFGRSYDYIIDAIDIVSSKLDLIETASLRSIPIISALGTGNKLDPSRLKVTDISKTTGCPLARVVRKELRKRGIYRLEVVFSDEEPVTPLPLEDPPPGRRSVPSSSPWVPPCAGLLMAGHVVMRLIAELYTKRSENGQDC